MGAEQKKPATTIQSVSRAVRVVLAVARSDRPVTPRELSEGLGLTLPTTYHLVATLEMEGMLARDGRRAYILGPAAALIADTLSHDYAAPQSYRTALRDLATETGEAVYLSAWRHGALCILESLEGTHTLGVSRLPVGYATHIHARASSKLLLAFAPDELRERAVAEAELEPLTPHTIVTAEHLERELDTIRRTGLSFDRGEVTDGVECVAVPIRAAGTVVAALAVQAPLDRFRRHEDEIVSVARAIASRVSS